jgi:hypothetical protein
MGAGLSSALTNCLWPPFTPPSFLVKSPAYAKVISIDNKRLTNQRRLLALRESGCRFDILILAVIRGKKSPNAAAICSFCVGLRLPQTGTSEGNTRRVLPSISIKISNLSGTNIL